MLRRAVLLCLALASAATSLDSSVLQSIVDLTACQIGTTVPGLRAEAFLFAVDELLPPGTNAEDNKGLSMNIASQNSVILIEGPEDVGSGVYSGFESGDFFSWSAPGDATLARTRDTLTLTPPSDDSHQVTERSPLNTKATQTLHLSASVGSTPRSRKQTAAQNSFSTGSASSQPGTGQTGLLGISSSRLLNSGRLPTIR